MSIFVIPTDPLGLSSYFMTVSLEGTSYQIELDYNERCAAWYLSVADADNVDIYNGVKLMTGFPLLKKCRDPRRPPGDFFVMSSTADQSPPALLDLLPGSGRCSLFYVTSDWISLVVPTPFDAATSAANVAALQAQVAAGAASNGLSTYGQQAP